MHREPPAVTPHRLDTNVYSEVKPGPTSSMSEDGSAPSGLRKTLRWAWASHREAPYRLSEVWTRAGRRARFERLSRARDQKVRNAAERRGIKIPAHWSPLESSHLAEVMVDGCYDRADFVPRSGETVVDVGCEFGDFTALAARAGARVISFDPNPVNLRHAQELLQANDLSAELRPVALGAQRGVIRMGFSTAARTMLQAGVSAESREVPVESLDSLALPRVDLLKIDVEGMEDQVLAGARAVLAEARPRLILEIHGKRASDAVRGLLGHAGYSMAEASPPRRVEEFGLVQNTFWLPH